MRKSYITSKSSQNSGFTLVELAIVVVIIGIIIAGIITASELSKNFKLRGVISEVEEYKTAIMTFRTKYNYYPGDMPDAQSYWGGGVGNGNGNRIITSETESLYAWEHLVKAGMISGAYDGTTATYNNIGVNIPASKAYDGGGYAYQSEGNVYSVPGSGLQALNLGSESESCNSWLNGVLMTSTESKTIDTKIDDGLADGGSVYTIRGEIASGCGTSTGCVTNPVSSSSASYVLTDTLHKCRMLFWLNKPGDM